MTPLGNVGVTYTHVRLSVMLSAGKASSNPAVRGNLVGGVGDTS
jgi:hypothetical protein